MDEILGSNVLSITVYPHERQIRFVDGNLKLNLHATTVNKEDDLFFRKTKKTSFCKSSS